MKLDIEQTVHDIREAGFNALNDLRDGRITIEEANEVTKGMKIANKVVAKEVKTMNKAYAGIANTVDTKPTVKRVSKPTAKKVRTKSYDSRGFTITKHTGLRIHKDGKKFLFDVMIDDKRYRKTYTSKATTLNSNDTLQQAYNALQIWLEDTKKQLSLSVDLSATVNEYYLKIYNDKKINNTNSKSRKGKKLGWSDDTAKRYNLFYEKYMQDSIGKLEIRKLESHHLTQYNRTLNHLSASRQSRSYELLKQIIDLAIEDKIISSSPITTKHVPKRDYQSEKKVILNAKEKYQQIYKSLNQIYNSNDIIVFEDKEEYLCSIRPHHLAIFLFGFHGRRLNEVVTLQWNDIDFINNQYRIRKEVSKIGIDMIFSLPSDVREVLLKFPDNSGDVFPIKNIDRYYKQIRKVSGIKEFTFHWMRNLSVSALAEAGVPTADLSAMLGHQDINTLNKYLSLQRTTATAGTNTASQKLLS